MKRIHANVSEETHDVKSRHRDQIDLLRSRLNLLSGKDRVLMTMYVENGNSFRQIARLLGVSETSIARRIHTMTKRLMDGEYIVCLRNRGKFTKRQMDVAKDYFLMGLSMRKIAEQRCWSVYRVRQTVMKIRSVMQNSE
ncbi:MAG: AsnC family protein [Planctomycetota bacterium]|jgi:predicted DNA-binding protein YlxM (UPF0122 family)